jgi:hypothetical protein
MVLSGPVWCLSVATTRVERFGKAVAAVPCRSRKNEPTIGPARVSTHPFCNDVRFRGPAFRRNSERERRTVMSWSNYPNLRLRPHAPNKGRGRLQRAVVHAFLAADSDVLSTPAVYAWCFPRCLRPSEGHRYSAFRILQEVATPVGRAKTIGRPILWHGTRSPNFS